MILKDLHGKVGRFLWWWLGGRRGDVSALEDLPLVLYPPVDPIGHAAGPLVVFLSGDGGWANLTSRVSEQLQSRGIPVAGIDCMRYFWKEKSAACAAADIERVIARFAAEWNRDSVIFIGYSMGADVLPPILCQLSKPARAQITHTVLLSIGARVSFRFLFSGWLGLEPPGSASAPLEPFLVEMRAENAFRIHAFRGQTENRSEAVEHLLDPVHVLPGGHHYGSDYVGLSRAICTALNIPPSPEGPPKPPSSHYAEVMLGQPPRNAAPRGWRRSHRAATTRNAPTGDAAICGNRPNPN